MRNLILLLSTLLVATPVLALDASKLDKHQHGKGKHNDDCQRCHTEKMYTRDNRKVRSINALGKQVRLCRDNTGTAWFDDDTDAVVFFLNEDFYKF